MVWHDTHRNSIGGIWYDHMVYGSMKNKDKDYTGTWVAFLLIALWCFWLVGCGSAEKNEEAETYPYSQEDPILELLIELGEVETI